jgi:DNA-binding response OmpR family regulator
VTRFVDDPPAIERLLRNQVPAHEKVVSIHLPNTSLDRWTCAISLDRLALPFRARRDVIRVLRLENDVPAVELAGDERLVVDVRTHTAWLDSVILDLTEGERATLEALAMASKRGRSLPAGELSTMVGGPKAGPEVAKQRIRSLRSAVRKSVEKEEPKLVQTVRRGEGYRLGISVFLVE